MTATRSFELKVKGGQNVVWDGLDGPDAAQRYAQSHPGATVLAWRDWPRVGFFPAVNVRRVVG